MSKPCLFALYKTKFPQDIADKEENLVSVEILRNLGSECLLKFGALDPTLASPLVGALFVRLCPSYGKQVMNVNILDLEAETNF